MEHTTTPWEVFTRFNGGTKELMIVDAVEGESDLIATLSTNLRAEGDAAFIIKACNAHDELLSTLKTTLAVLEGVGTTETVKRFVRDARKITDKAE